MAKFVCVEDIVFDYGFTRALDGISFAVAAETVTALVGPNGAGKTTLLRCLAGLERPLSGRVTIDGIDVADHPRRVHRLLGFQQDFFGIYAALSVRRNLLHAAAIQAVPEPDAARAVEWAAAMVGLSPRLDHVAGELSRGLRQRLAIARAIVHRPRLLLMDEPASGLDPEARRELAHLIRTLTAGGMTIIVSSHILAELDDYSTHMLALRDGRAAPTVGLDKRTGQRWRLEVAGGAAAALPLLAALDGVAEAAMQDDGIAFTFSGDDLARSRLLRRLLDAEVAVSALAPASGLLEELYLGGRR
ncbi:MAG: ATP-binding cassette domain-containing protein [Magnetospirillum sp.]|nr:ATP-binding cassette domain-containing protein [Magnetospirillum sp.]